MKIIAESAFNHNGSTEYVKDLATVAKDAGADYFTVQVMDVESFCVSDYSKYNIYSENTLSFAEWENVFDHCNSIGIEVIPNVLDIPSLEFCMDLGHKFIKIHATDITNSSMLDKLAFNKELKLILETQCATNLEINFALSKIGHITECLMHGFSNYPTEIEDLNLNSLIYLSSNFAEYKIGFADQSLDTDKIPLMAMAMGCQYLEKHITLSRNNRNFDWQVSLYPNEFSLLVSNVKHYSQALGVKMKHPTKSELGYRDVMYKKYLGEGIFKRADSGNDYITSLFNSFDKGKVGIALIARLKSQRLLKKVLKPINDTVLIDFLYKRLEKTKKIDKVYLATSSLLEDKELVDLGISEGHNVFEGHPNSVIDRMLEISQREEWGGVFRVTGDNPMTDINLIDEMIEMFVENDLDYVRVNNVPFGVSAELFSTSYLWKLYLNMDNPMNSEYLTWFIVKDNDANKGCIDIESEIEDLKYINLSVDYQMDLDRVYHLVNNLGDKNLYDINIQDYVGMLGSIEREAKEKLIKLPNSLTITFKDFLGKIEMMDYSIRKKIKI